MAPAPAVVALTAFLPEAYDAAVASVRCMSLEFDEKESAALRDFAAAGERCLAAIGEKAREKLRTISQGFFEAKDALAAACREHEEEIETYAEFWEKVAETSAEHSKMGKAFDLANGKWLGNGKYGYILLTKRHEDARQVVLKMLDVRHAHLAAKEWQHGLALQGHASIVSYQSVFLYGDEDKSLKRLIEAGFASGKLTSGLERTKFPERWVGLVEEFMSRGTVQNWMDEDLLSAEGMLKVLRKVASALDHMHSKGIAHNDIKPENILLDQRENRIIVKLGDLGLAERSNNRHEDFWRYAMTGVCLVTGEAFGSRKFKAEKIDTFVGDVKRCVAECGAEGKLATALADLPNLLQDIFLERLSMKEVKERESLQNWNFMGDAPSPDVANSKRRSTLGNYVGATEADDRPNHRLKTLSRSDSFIKDLTRKGDRLQDAAGRQAFESFFKPPLRRKLTWEAEE